MVLVTKAKKSHKTYASLALDNRMQSIVVVTYN